MLFNRECFDPRHPSGICKHNHYKIIEINHTKRYGSFDPFIIAQNERKVYYVSHPRKCKSKWRAVIKIKAWGRVEAEDVSKTYKVDDSRVVIIYPFKGSY